MASDETPPRKKQITRAEETAHLLDAMHDLTDEVKGLREEIRDRPTRKEVTGRRRASVMILLVLMFFTVQITDLHTEYCGPGHKSEAIVEALVNGKIRTQEDFNKIANDSTPSDLCGFTFPTHTHDGHKWPERQHLMGLAFYFLIFLSLAEWTRRGFKQHGPGPMTTTPESAGTDTHTGPILGG